MKFRLQFNMDNDAFQNGNQKDEIKNILMDVKDTINQGFDHNYTGEGNIHDINRNRIGQWSIEEGEEG